MRREYDFSKAVRGRFYKKDVELRLPIYLEPKLRNKLECIARRTGKDVGTMMNQMLRKEVDFIEYLT